MSKKVKKSRIGSLILVFTMLFSVLGNTRISRAEADLVEREVLTTVDSEQLTKEEGEVIFEDSTGIELDDTEEIGNLEEMYREDALLEDEVITEVGEVENKTELFEEMVSEVEVIEKETLDESKVIVVDEIESEEVFSELIEEKSNESVIETLDEGFMVVESKVEDNNLEMQVNVKEFETTDTIVKDENEDIIRKIKDGDFFVEVKEAIKDTAGNILGWVNGVIVGDNGDYDDEGNWNSNLEIEEGYFPIVANDNGSGSWVANIRPDSEGTSYYKVVESKKYQEREILADGSEGELLYNADGSPRLASGPLPGVKYDERVYYLKYVNGELAEVKIVMPGDDNPLDSIVDYTAEQVKAKTDTSIDYDDEKDPIDFFIEYLKESGVESLSEDVFNSIKSYEGTSLDFVNEFELPKGEVEVGADKNLTGKDLSDDEFEFVVKDLDGNIIGKGTNDSDGNISFNIPVDHEGEFEYILEEVKGKNSNIVYDGTIYKLVVKVKYDRLTNTFKTELVYKDAEGNILDIGAIPEFNNKYIPPIEPPIEPPTEPPVNPPTPKEPPVTPPNPELPEIPQVPEEPKVPEKPIKSVNPEEPIVVMEVPNEPKIAELPQTGIEGMALFTTSGVSLLLAGVWMLRNKNDK